MAATAVRSMKAAGVRKTVGKVRKGQAAGKGAGKQFSHGLVSKKHPATPRTGVAKSKAVPADKGSEAAGAPVGVSPFPGFQRPTVATVRSLHSGLAKLFGKRVPPKTRPRRPILDLVVRAILSQNTTNTNSSEAFSRLKKAFPKWDQVRQSTPKPVETAIKCGGLAPTKTKRIQAMLKTIYKEHGATSLEHLRKASKWDVHDELCQFSGVGKKTAAIVNMFDIGNPDFAVDTHVFRYATQLGWLPSEQERTRHNKTHTDRRTRWPQMTRDTCYEHLDAIVPDELKYSMHLLLTDTWGGLPTRCPAGKELRFDRNVRITVDGEVLRK